MKILLKSLSILVCLYSLSSSAQITYTEAFPNLDFEFPVEIQPSNDGTDRLFVVEQAGRIKVFDNDSNTPSSNTFLDITSQVYFEVGAEIGLLGLAFHPDYITNGYFYVYYTIGNFNTDIEIVLSRFSVSSGDNNAADIGSELVIFRFDKNVNENNHNGGKIAFGPDGYLYISLGDGGGANDPLGNGQNINTVFGSVCRIDIDIDGSNPIESNPALPNGNYETPSDNPFVGQAGLDEIYAYGIRNTWKFSFDNPTGRLWAADVGQNAFEEINLIENGENYGWSRFEGNSIANSNVTINEPTTFPVFSYDRNQGDVSITGGYVYRGSEVTSNTPDINGKFIFGDYVSGRVWALDYNETTGEASSTLLFRTSGEFISSFGLDESGELYFSDYGTNAEIYKLVDGTTPPSGTAVNGTGNWSQLNEGIINGEVQAICANSQGDVYHAGNFTQVGTINANNIAVWNATNGWSTMGSGSNGTVNALKLDSNGNLYAGGSFTEIGGISANNIAVWNGTNWSAVGNGIDGPVLALEIDNSDNIYVGGTFETVSGITVRNIALWDGTVWSALTDSSNATSGTNNEIRSLHIDDSGILYVGGNFGEAGGNTANRIATWDGSNWGTLGTGTSGFVQAICTTPTDVYIGGNFAIAGGQTVNRLARWNKTASSWNTVGNGVSNNVNTLIHDGTYLYAAGTFDLAFTSTENPIVKNIARYSSANEWEALGPNQNVGVDIKVNDIAFALDGDGVNKIFVGGNFSNAGNISANNTATWLSETLTTDDFEKQNVTYYPNPTNGILHLSGSKIWTLYNNLGQILSNGDGSLVNLSNYSKGVYFLTIENSETIKIIKE